MKLRLRSVKEVLHARSHFARPTVAHRKMELYRSLFICHRIHILYTPQEKIPLLFSRGDWNPGKWHPRPYPLGSGMPPPSGTS